MTREQLIAKAAVEVFTQGCLSLDTAMTLSGEQGFDVGHFEEELQRALESA